jgi:hypothetical protein
MRWLGWFALRALKWLSVPALIGVGLTWWWLDTSDGRGAATGPLSSNAASVPVTAAASAPSSRADAAPASASGADMQNPVQLRLDASSAGPSAASSAQAQSASSPDNDGRERER